jgi:hypothetical protein
MDEELAIDPASGVDERLRAGLDERLRAVLQDSVAGDSASAAALRSVSPRLRAARRRHQIRIAIVTTAALGLAGTAAAITIPRLSSDPSVIVVSGPDGPGTGVTPRPTETTPVATTGDVPTRRSTTTVPSSDRAPIGTPNPPTPDAGNPTPTTGLSTTSAQPTPSTTTPGAAGGSTPTTGPSTSSAAQPDTSTTPAQVIETDCGSISVSIRGDSIWLTATQADPGYAEDVKEAGPQAVEVSFEGPGGHCEIHAWARNGVLMSEIDDE